MSTAPPKPTGRNPKRSPSQVSEIMGRVRSRDTEPEKLFRKALRRVGIRAFRVCDVKLPGKPDLVLPGKALAIFIDGDFWHGHQYKARGFESLDAQLFGIHNAHYWSIKISRNIERDFRNTAALLDAGWRVLRFWGSDVRKDAAKCAQLVLRSLRSSEIAAHSALASQTVVELFAGIGLVRLALEKCGWRTLFANDNDSQKVEMYRENFGAEGFDARSVHDLCGKDIPTCALLTASFPCNDLSVAGSRGGLNDGQSSAFWSVIRLLKEMRRRRPPLVLLENVPGFLTSHGGSDLEAALLALTELGYACDVFLVDASNFAPQSRIRLFVIAKVGESGPGNHPPLLGPSEVRPKALTDFITSHSEVRWSLRALPQLPNLHPNLSSIVEDLPEDHPHWWNQERSEYFLNQLSSRHLKIAKYMISQPAYSYGTAFRRIRHGKSMAELRVDGIAGCLRTPRGGSGRQILFKAGCGKYWVRLLTPRECARLQGVRDEDFKIGVPANQALFGFGDAVCVPVVQWIADNYLTPIAAELMRGRVLGCA